MNNASALVKILLLMLIAYGLFFFMKREWSLAPNLNEFADATELHPVVAEKRDELIRRSKDKGITVVITDDFRSKEEQDQLYAKGRTTEGNIVTYSKGGESYHNYGLAIDFALEIEKGKVIWDMEYDGNQNGMSDWMEVVEIGKELGFEWGGDWEGFKDYPHFQMNPQDLV
ncbi:M15 family metallopeptidase [Priestia megaterium]|nr:M15 family metallopeptidase [Priestia megaterium]